MIDHMILNLKKYYESEVPYLVGKNIRLPEKSIPFYGDPNPYNGVGNIKNAILSIEQNGATATTTSGFINYAGTTCQVVMQASGIAEIDGKDTGNINGTYQTFVNLRYPKNERSSMPGWLCLSQILQNGGVSSSLLTHVYHAFILARKELSMAISKILFGRVQYLKKDYPDQVVIPAGKSVTFINTSWVGGQTLAGGLTTQKYTLNVKGEVTNMYFCQVPKNTNDEIHIKGEYPEHASGYRYIGVMKSNCIPVVQNGGATSLLSHIGRCLQSLLRNEVVA